MADAHADSMRLRLLVQPRGWQPPGADPGAGLLAEYLSKATGIAIAASQSADSLSHWRSVRGESTSELVLDEAQFTDFLIQQRHYTVLAQSAQVMRFTLVVRPGTVFTDPADLSARRIAVPAPPSLAALRLLELFPRPAHVPAMVRFQQVPQALRALRNGQVQGALLPMIDGQDYPNVQLTLVTDASPGLGFSASPGVTQEQRRGLARALLKAHRSENGQRALTALAIPAFELSSASAYEGSSGLLRGTWGYSSTE